MKEAIYYMVFFEQGKKKNCDNARNKRVKKQVWDNIIDDFPDKKVTLEAGTETQEFHVLSATTFHISNSVDNSYFAVCEIKKVK